jgi:hypothetical protein
MSPLLVKDDRKETTQVVGFLISLPELRSSFRLATHIVIAGTSKVGAPSLNSCLPLIAITNTTYNMAVK